MKLHFKQARLVLQEAGPASGGRVQAVNRGTNIHI